MLKISSSTFHGLEVEFQDSFNFIIGDSATGKTYMSSLIAMYCDAHETPYVYFNYKNSERKILLELDNYDSDDAVIIFDNCNMIMTSAIQKKLLNIKGTKIMMVRDLESVALLLCESPGVYMLDYDNGVLKSSREYTL